jgi:hypothetical protein
MQIENIFGDHTIFKYNTKNHHFLEYFQNLFKTKTLDSIENIIIVDVKDT